MHTKKDTKDKQEFRLNIRINPVWRAALGVAAKARWTDATGLIHQFVKAVVAIEREKYPAAFSQFGDLDSIPIEDTTVGQVIPTNVPDDIRRIAHTADTGGSRQRQSQETPSPKIPARHSAKKVGRVKKGDG